MNWRAENFLILIEQTYETYAIKNLEAMQLTDCEGILKL